MSIESTNKVIDFMKARKQKIDMLIAEKQKQVYYGKKFAGRYFRLKEQCLWIDKGCGKCHRGMSKYLYDKQIENGRTPETTICSGCSKRADKKALKELDR
jgi:ABC-type phosphate/phosphonate transport system ATPase subunit